MNRLGHTDSLSWFFGGASQASFPEQYSRMTAHPLGQYQPFGHILNSMGARAGYILSQTHSTTGYQVDDSWMHQPSFIQQGDYLITHSPGIAIGVLTADCLPIIIHDPRNQAVAVIHAGWRGAVGGIIERALDHMHRVFNTVPGECRALLGPSAQVCCYQVGNDFLALFSPDQIDRYFKHDSRGLFFDLPSYVVEQLRSFGIAAQSIDRSHNDCTIHSLDYCSYRRDGSAAGRQITFAMIPD